MLNLYKTDLKRIFKDKLFMVSCIIAGAFAILTPLLNLTIFLIVPDADDSFLTALNINAKTIFFASFSPGNNLGLIAPILIAIILCKDFSYGTVRNKIISGRSRALIFLSYLAACATVLCIIIFGHAALTLGFSLIFFDYQATAFVLADFGYLMLSLFMELLVYLFIAAIISFLCVFVKKSGLIIVLYVAVNFLFSIAGTIIATVRIFIDPAKTFLYDLMQFLDQANIFAGTYIGIVEKYNWQGVLPIVIGTILGASVFALLGILAFKKKDLK